jgi:hypothetical protein
MDEEARYVAKFFFDERIPVRVTLDGLKEPYRKDAISP